MPISSTDSLSPTAALPSDRPLLATLLQSIVKLSSSVLDELNGQSPLVEDAAVNAIQALMTIIEQLQAPDSGWPSDLPHTPEAIAPYVAEEIDRVMEVKLTSTADVVNEAPRSDDYIELGNLLPRLLWSVVHSSDEAMALLEGVAIYEHNGQLRQAGQLRLIPYLELGWPMPDPGNSAPPRLALVTLDLTTQQAPPPLLSPTVQIESADPAWSQELTTVAALLNHLLAQWQQMLPNVRSRLELPLDVLVPDLGWQPVTMQMRLGLEFFPLVEFDSGLRASGSEPWQAAPAEPAEEDLDWMSATLRFSDPSWLDAYLSVMAHQHLRTVIAHYSHEWQAIAQLEPDQAAPQIVQQACKTNELLHHPSYISAHTLQSTMTLPQLRHWLIWNLSRRNYALMQLLGGIPARFLLPGENWTSGMLRLLPSLHLQFGDRLWQLDLTTAAPLAHLPSLPATGILHPLSPDGSRSPQTVQDLHQQILSNICLSPVLDRMRQPVAIHWVSPDGDRPGHLSLHLHLEFLPC